VVGINRHVLSSPYIVYPLEGRKETKKEKGRKL
jgi:hypothetical protein